MSVPAALVGIPFRGLRSRVVTDLKRNLVVSRLPVLLVEQKARCPDDLRVCVRELPCIGKSVAMSTSGSPSPLYSTGEQDDAGSAVTFPPLPLELLFPPQPAAAKASTPISMANSPSVPYLLKIHTSVARSLVITRKGGSIEAFGPASNPEPLKMRVKCDAEGGT